MFVPARAWSPARVELPSPCRTGGDALSRQVRAVRRYAVAAAVLALLALMVSLRSAEVARRGRALVSLKDEMTWVQAENRRLEAQVLALQSPARIEREAERLGFKRPEAVAVLPEVPAGLLPTAGPPPGLAVPVREVRLVLPPERQLGPYAAAGLLSGLGALAARVAAALAGLL